MQRGLSAYLSTCSQFAVQPSILKFLATIFDIPGYRITSCSNSLASQRGSNTSEANWPIEMNSIRIQSTRHVYLQTLQTKTLQAKQAARVGTIFKWVHLLYGHQISWSLVEIMLYCIFDLCCFFLWLYASKIFLSTEATASKQC